MGRLAERQRVNPQAYEEAHVRAILGELGVRIAADTVHDFLCFCPFHNNRNTPSLSVSKTKDSYLCFNADCGASGTLAEMVSKISGRNYFESSRYILKHAPSEQQVFEQTLATLLDEKPEFREFSEEVLGNLYENMRGDNPGRTYLRGRGFTDDTIDYFKVGYSGKKNMVAVPMHSPDGIPVGVVGRSIAGKAFKNSVGLPTSKTFFNLHRAKRVGGTVIVTEASFDAMAVHQAGYPNVVANLGGHMSSQKLYLLDRYFDKIILFLDNPLIDDSGKKLGEKIVNGIANRKEVVWARAGLDWYPGGLKDATSIQEEFGEAATEQIKKSVQKAIPIWEYRSLMV
jgi:DNA primase